MVGMRWVVSLLSLSAFIVFVGTIVSTTNNNP
jgi:hypothetical protein